MKIKLTSIYVDDQEKALAFYTGKLGFQKKADYPAGDFRWITIVSPEEPDGVEVFLQPNANPAAKALQQALKDNSERAAVFHTADLESDYERMKGLGVVFTQPPQKEAWGAMATLDDTCGNLIQLIQPAW